MDLKSTKMETHLKTRMRKFGFSYGAAAGFAFAIALWGFDGLLLSRAHGLFPWLKLIVGTILTTLTGGLAGWLTARFEKTLLGILFWLGASGLLAIFTSIVPLVLTPRLIGVLEPQIKPFLIYTTYNNLPYMVGVAFGWVVVSSIIIAVVQIPMLDQAIFSITGFGKIKPHIICVFLMLISGSVADSLNNKPLRDPILGLDETIQFMIDTRGQTVEPALSREKHLASFRNVQDAIHENRHLVVSNFDPLLENVEVLINFNEQWVSCSTFYGTPLSCKAITQ
jgi:hypothetical protein